MRAADVTDLLSRNFLAAYGTYAFPGMILQGTAFVLAGGFGGFLYWSLFYPVDVIKSAMMTDAINKSDRKYKGFMDAASQLYKQGGVKRLYAGLVPCLLRASPANAGMLFVVDKVKQILDGV